MKKKLVFVVNNSAFFVSHRLPLAQAAVARGFDVTVLAPNDERREEIARAGVQLEKFYLHRKSINPLREFMSLISLYQKLNQLKPDVVHGVSLKACLYSSIVGRLLRVPNLVQSITGLGYVFIDQNRRAKVIRNIAGLAFKITFRSRRIKFIFQNRDDQNLFLMKKWIYPEQAHLVRGVGVDLQKFHPIDAKNASLSILFPARLLKDKGLMEFVQACCNLKNKGLAFTALVAGGEDLGNPNGIPKKTIQSWHSEGLIQWLGHVKDMAPLFQKTDVVCLPSYREGLPLALVEAAAAGKPIVTTDVPGCREVVTDNQNGFLVKPRDASDLASKLEIILSSEQLRLKMGLESRRIAEKHFSSQNIISQTISLY